MKVFIVICLSFFSLFASVLEKYGEGVFTYKVQIPVKQDANSTIDTLLASVGIGDVDVRYYAVVIKKFDKVSLVDAFSAKYFPDYLENMQTGWYRSDHAKTVQEFSWLDEQYIKLKNTTASLELQIEFYNQLSENDESLGKMKKLALVKEHIKKKTCPENYKECREVYNRFEMVENISKSVYYYVEVLESKN